MEHDRFDELAARLASRLTRRRLGILGTAIPGGLLLATSATAKPKKKPCPPCVGRKKGKCKKQLPDGALCTGGTCQGGQCLPCPAGQRQCQGRCITPDQCCENSECPTGGLPMQVCIANTCQCVPAGQPVPGSCIVSGGFCCSQSANCITSTCN